MDRKRTLLARLTLASMLLTGCSPGRSEDPLLSRLRHGLERGEDTALEAFWETVERTGTPLIHPRQQSDGTYLTTFLWREVEPVDNVVVVAEFNDSDVTRNQMHKVEGTDVWQFSIALPAEAYFNYSLSPDDSLIPLYEAVSFMQRAQTFIPDPLNPHQLDMGFYRVSTAALPEAPSEPWLESPRPITLKSFPVESESLGEIRDVGLYAPRTGSIDHAPLVVVFDGGVYGGVLGLPQVFDWLIEQDRTPPFAAAFVANRQRANDLRDNPAFVKFVAEELLPRLRQELHVSERSLDTIVVGSSYGGLTATRIAFEHPDRFGKVVALSPSFQLPQEGIGGENALVDALLHEIKPLEIFLSVGTFETAPKGEGRLTQLEVARMAARSWSGAGYRLHYSEYPGGHEYLNWRWQIARALETLLSGS